MHVARTLKTALWRSDRAKKMWLDQVNKTNRNPTGKRQIADRSQAGRRGLKGEGRDKQRRNKEDKQRAKTRKTIREKQGEQAGRMSRNNKHALWRSQAQQALTQALCVACCGQIKATRPQRHHYI